MRSSTITYTVEVPRFVDPTDMLRRDQSFAAGDEDKGFLERLARSGSLGPGDLPSIVRINLISHDHGAPNTARWESFGCKVVECSDPWKISAPKIEPVKVMSGDEALARAIRADGKPVRYASVDDMDGLRTFWESEKALARSRGDATLADAICDVLDAPDSMRRLGMIFEAVKG